MKRSVILCTVLLSVLCVFFIQLVRACTAIPLTFKLNWLTITPAMALWMAFVALLIRKGLRGSARRVVLEPVVPTVHGMGSCSLVTLPIGESYEAEDEFHAALDESDRKQFR